MNLVYFSIAIIAGFLMAKFFSAKKTGQRGHFKSIRFRIGENILHIHHWLYSCVALLVMWQIDFYNNFIYGFFIGVAVQGLMYKDFYYVFYNEKEYRKKYPG